jgi:RNA polymerase sigma factor (sigma-70 family)
VALSEDALYDCYRRLEKPLFNVLYRQLWQAQDCQDLMHDTYLRLWERRDRIDPATLDPLVWTTALNLARNRLRWRALRRFEPLSEGQFAACDGEPDFLAVRRLHDALRRLPLASQQILLLAEFGGLRDAEIAATLRAPLGTVASRKHQARRRLKQRMEQVVHV